MSTVFVRDSARVLASVAALPASAGVKRTLKSRECGIEPRSRLKADQRLAKGPSDRPAFQPYREKLVARNNSVDFGFKVGLADFDYQRVTEKSARAGSHNFQNFVERDRVPAAQTHGEMRPQPNALSYSRNGSGSDGLRLARTAGQETRGGGMLRRARE